MQVINKRTKIENVTNKCEFDYKIPEEIPINKVENLKQIPHYM